MFFYILLAVLMLCIKECNLMLTCKYCINVYKNNVSAVKSILLTIVWIPMKYFL